MSSPEAAAAVIDAWFADSPDLEVERVGDDGWFTVLAGERKRTIPVHLEVGAHTLTVQSFFMRAPDENAGEVYALLLRRNRSTYTCRFALYDTGDLMLIGVVPLHAVTAEELDRLMGQLLESADSTYDAALRRGFAGYIEAEQAWRAGLGMPRNPIT